MSKSEIAELGDREELCESLYAKKKKILNYTFGISSAVGILTGSIIGMSMAKGTYETVLFILFFGCFLGSLFGAIFTIVTVKGLYTLLLYLFSPVYRRCRKPKSAAFRSES